MPPRKAAAAVAAASILLRGYNVFFLLCAVRPQCITPEEAKEGRYLCRIIDIQLSLLERL